MAGAKSTGTINDEYGHGVVVSDIERIFQLLENDPEAILPNDTNGESLSITTLDVCVNGVAMKIDVLAGPAYLA